MITTIYEKTVGFGKIKAERKTRRCAAEVTITLQEHTDPQRTIDGAICARPIELLISGAVWNGNHTDLIYGGQCCLDLMLSEPELAQNAKLQRIAEVWRRWNQNTWRYCTKRQARAFHLCSVLGIEVYGHAIETLERINLLYDNGYKYDSAWLVEPLPDEIITEVKSW